MNETVRRFLPMVDFLEQILGKNSEIVLHDFSDPDHAIVDIRNGIVSGRKVGGPATDLALKIMHDPQVSRPAVYYGLRGPRRRWQAAGVSDVLYPRG